MLLLIGVDIMLILVQNNAKDWYFDGYLLENTLAADEEKMFKIKR